ncbi:MAG TPA: hypothetical protein VEF34_03670 [Syntrophobacteraceae bacterium]|nr:hypothetical protein [Syntrophobacteraceae bacterium]
MNRSAKAVFVVVSFVAAFVIIVPLATIPAFAQAKPTPADITLASNTQTGYQFIGFTTATTKGGAGMFAMNAMCANAFGLGARVCFSDEFLRSPVALPIGTPGSHYAWVYPTIVAVYYDPSQKQPVYVDASGVTGSINTLSCGQWTVNSSKGMGLVVATPKSDTTTFSLFGTAECLNSFNITCCAQ